MAPKRGGGGSGGGGGGGGVSSLEDTPWGQTVSLYGLGFRRHIDRAHLAFQVIGLIGIVVIIIWATMFKKHHEPTKRVFKWWAFWLSVFAVFV